MRVSKLVGLCLALALVVPATAALADEGRISMRGGAFFPTDSNAQTLGDKVWWNLGLSYTFAGTETAAHKLGVAWMEGTETTPPQSSLRVVPLTYTYELRPGGAEKGLFYGVGGGVYLVRGTLAGFADENRTKFGANVSAGYAFSPVLDVQASFTKVLGDTDFDNIADAKLDGFAVTLGGRF